MTTFSLSPHLTIGYPRRIFFVFFFTVCSLNLFAQSDKAFQIEVGIEHYIEPEGIEGRPAPAAAGGFFVEGKYQKGQFEAGVKAGTALWQYGSDHHGVGSGFGNQPVTVIIYRDYFENLDYYAEAFANYRPTFRSVKPFFGFGMRYFKSGNGRIVNISATENTVTDLKNAANYFTPVLKVGYYHKKIKFHLDYCFGQRSAESDINPSGRYYPGFFTAGVSYAFGIGKRKEAPLEELPLSFFRPLLVRLEGGLNHRVAISDLGIGSSLHASLELTVRISKKLRVGFRTEGPLRDHGASQLGEDDKSLEYYFTTPRGAYTRSINTSNRITSNLLIIEYIPKTTHRKDLLIVGAGLGVYKIERTNLNSYVDNGVRIELPALLKDATVPGLYLRVGQRFGAFSHSAFVNVMPGQVPVTFGIQAGLGLNVFGKKRMDGE
ncbi:MAG: hypothetical protein HUU01_14295 [Saprospiraceae bacterium]|nr:hypothetical protein [Saprospiraceae bacterium]